MSTKLYTAPLEGVTGFAWRKAHSEIFGCADKYFSPFLSPTEHHSFTTRELRDITQDEKNLVPQILASKADHFVWATEYVMELGYSEVNLNLGCPSGTVVSKGKGSGMLRDTEALDRFLDEIFERLSGRLCEEPSGNLGGEPGGNLGGEPSGNPGGEPGGNLGEEPGGKPDGLRISVKTRTGLNDSSNWPAILDVFNKYPISELIIHPRAKTEMYKGKANRELFLDTMKKTELPLVYNGDVATPDDEALSFGCPVMVGRGLIRRPALFREIRGGKSATRSELANFHDLVLEYYQIYISGDSQILHKMKEFWHYFEDNFDAPDSLLKKIYKSKSLSEYKMAVNSVFK